VSSRRRRVAGDGDELGPGRYRRPDAGACHIGPRSWLAADRCRRCRHSGFVVGQRRGVDSPGIAFVPFVGAWIVILRSIGRSGVAGSTLGNPVSRARPLYLGCVQGPHRARADELVDSSVPHSWSEYRCFLGLRVHSRLGRAVVILTRKTARVCLDLAEQTALDSRTYPPVTRPRRISCSEGQ
jgi:hypothetical protein